MASKKTTGTFERIKPSIVSGLHVKKQGYSLTSLHSVDLNNNSVTVLYRNIDSCD